MKLLALDTSTEACTAALWVDGEVLHRHVIAPRDHSKLILPMFDALLAEAGLSLQDMDALAFGRGPGSFTGVRIGTAVAQGVAFSADLPVLSVSTLATLAQGAYREFGEQRVAAAIDARMGEVYLATYQLDDASAVMVSASEEQVIKPDLLEALPGEGWFGVGTGWDTYPVQLSERLAVMKSQGERYPDARDLVVLAEKDWQAGKAIPAEQAVPIYLRDKVAAKPGERL